MFYAIRYHIGRCLYYLGWRILPVNVRLPVSLINAVGMKWIDADCPPKFTITVKEWERGSDKSSSRNGSRVVRISVHGNRYSSPSIIGAAMRWSETWGNPAWAHNMRTLLIGIAVFAGLSIAILVLGSWL